jgi:hypothetical protein
MYRALLTAISLFIIPLSFAQNAEVKKSPARVLIKAKCTFPDGTLVSEQLIEMNASASAEEKRAAAARACEPIMEAASARCDELANQVTALRSEWRIAEPFSSRAHQLKGAMKKAFEAAPSYCK